MGFLKNKKISFVFVNEAVCTWLFPQMRCVCVKGDEETISCLNSPSRASQLICIQNQFPLRQRCQTLRYLSLSRRDVRLGRASCSCFYPGLVTRNLGSRACLVRGHESPQPKTLARAARGSSRTKEGPGTAQRFVISRQSQRDWHLCSDSAVRLGRRKKKKIPASLELSAAAAVCVLPAQPHKEQALRVRSQRGREVRR